MTPMAVIAGCCFITSDSQKFGDGRVLLSCAIILLMGRVIIRIDQITGTWISMTIQNLSGIWAARLACETVGHKGKLRREDEGVMRIPSACLRFATRPFSTANFNLPPKSPCRFVAKAGRPCPLFAH